MSPEWPNGHSKSLQMNMDINEGYDLFVPNGSRLIKNGNWEWDRGGEEQGCETMVVN